MVCFFIWLLFYYSIGSLIRTVFLSAMEKITGKILGLLTKGKILVSLSLAKKKKNFEMNTGDSGFGVCWPSVFECAKPAFLDRVESGVECVCMGLLW